MRIRRFVDVELPRTHALQPLVGDAAARLARDLHGIPLCLEDPYEDCARAPWPRREPLGHVTAAQPAGTHVLATIQLDLDATGGDRLARFIDAGEMCFGLWGIASYDCETDRISECRPTSVRLSNTRRLR